MTNVQLPPAIYIRFKPVKVNMPQCLTMCSQLPGVPNSRIFWKRISRADLIRFDIDKTHSFLKKAVNIYPMDGAITFKKPPLVIGTAMIQVRRAILVAILDANLVLLLY